MAAGGRKCLTVLAIIALGSLSAGSAAWVPAGRGRGHQERCPRPRPLNRDTL
jgi:hypothetical protein